jgi:hypothetical protein
MTRFAQVRHSEWIDAPVATVRSQFGDIDHHIRAGVHPGLRFESLAAGPACTRFVQEVRLLGLRQRDVFERRIDAAGSIHDVSVEGFNRGGTLDFAFVPDRGGTRVDIIIRLPMPGPMFLLRRLLEAQIRREVRAAALQDKHDIEVRGYPARAMPRCPAWRPERSALRARPAAGGWPRCGRG